MKHKFKTTQEYRDGQWIVTVRCTRCGLKDSAQYRASLLSSTISLRVIQLKRDLKAKSEDCPTIIARIVHDT